MKEIYWIQRIGAISTVSTIFAILLAVATIGLFIGYLIWRLEATTEDEIKTVNILKKWFIRVVVAFLIFTTMSIFIPSEKDLYVIYGVGGTIDYLKENDTAKQLPDKTIKCLDKWMTVYLEEESKENNNNIKE